jgi:pyruvate dehydrogenase E1 component alpha subunit
MDAVGLYRTMVRIRRFEHRVEQLFLAGKLPGFVHLVHRAGGGARAR